MALTGVLGEAMDLGVEELSEWLFETVSAEGIKVEEDDDRELDRSEPCWEDADLELVWHSPTKPLGLAIWNSKAKSSVPRWKVYSLPWG
jgi:hypothetical protein